tara:strand:+ start:1288 stop:1647 length:360 start_codon:yes stop_codon:yes gene_type:complete
MLAFILGALLYGLHFTGYLAPWFMAGWSILTATVGTIVIAKIAVAYDHAVRRYGEKRGHEAVEGVFFKSYSELGVGSGIAIQALSWYVCTGFWTIAPVVSILMTLLYVGFREIVKEKTS